VAVYNLFYTSQPVLALGVFDQDVSAEYSSKFPQLYAPGLSSSLFNKKVTDKRQHFFRVRERTPFFLGILQERRARISDQLCALFRRSR